MRPLFTALAWIIVLDQTTTLSGSSVQGYNSVVQLTVFMLLLFSGSSPSPSPGPSPSSSPSPSPSPGPSLPGSSPSPSPSQPPLPSPTAVVVSPGTLSVFSCVMNFPLLPPPFPPSHYYPVYSLMEKNCLIKTSILPNF